MFKLAEELLQGLKKMITNDHLQPALAHADTCLAGGCNGCDGGCYGGCSHTCIQYGKGDA